MKSFLLVLFITLCTLSLFANQENKITEKNWMEHPQIITIRQIFAKIENQIKAKQLVEKKREFNYCEPYEDSERVIYIDSNNKILKYTKSGGSDDSARKASFYYDDKGKLIFVFITGGAVNGSQFERRIYFNNQGQRIWENHKLLKGPGYFYPEVWNENDIVFDPVRAFNNKHKCEN